MNSLKTAVVVTVLLGVMYAVYSAINNGIAIPSVGRDGWPAANGGKEQSPGPGNAPPMNVQVNVPAGPDARGQSPKPGKLALPGPRNGPDGPVAVAPSPFSPSAPRAPLNPPGSDGDIRKEFAEMMQTVRTKLDGGQLKEVLRELTPLYGNPELTAEESRQLTDLLDQLAGSVVYSRQHLLERPYIVKAGDSPQGIAEQYRVPWDLLAKINGVADPSQLQPGRELKVLRGPFDVLVYLDRFELVLEVDRCYAGRFPIGIGRDEPQLEGRYTVREKTAGIPYRAPDGEIPAQSPANPLGKFWIGLDGRIGLHGTDDPRNLRRNDNRGYICLGERDIEDVFDILSVGSQVMVRRSVAAANVPDGAPRLSERRTGANPTM